MSPAWDPRGEDVRTSDCPGGPLLVRGADEVVSPEGEHVEVRRAVVALCRCDASTIRPWCDGSHKVVRTPAPAAGARRAG